MPVLTDEDVGLAPSYLSDEDVGLGAQASGNETWSPEEQAKLDAEQADLAPQTGFGAGLRRLRASPAGEALLGPTQAEREGGAMSTGSPVEIANTMLKFTAVPPQLADATRDLTGRFINSLPPVAGGVVRGAQELALNLPLAPIPIAPRTVMAAFGGDYLAGLPEAKQAYQEALDRGDTKAAAAIATQTVGGGALLALGGAHEAMKFTPPERGGIPEPVKPQETQNAIQEPSADAQMLRQPQPEVGLPQVGEGNAKPQEPAAAQTQPEAGNAPQEPQPVLLTPETGAIQLPKKPAQEKMNSVDAHEFAQWARNKTVSELRQLRSDHEEDPGIHFDDTVKIINDVIKEKSTSLKASFVPAETLSLKGAEEGQQKFAQAQAEVAAAQTARTPEERAQRLADARSRWTKATDTENLKAATPEERVSASEKPLDVESFQTTDSEGYKSVDLDKLRTAVEGGHITSGNAATDALVLHLLKPSDLHPLESVRMLDHTPQDAQALLGTQSPLHGRWSKRSSKSAAMIDMVMKMQRGEPVSSAEFLIVLGHELGHNNITSKFRDAPPEIQRDVTDLFTFVKERAKGTEFENHNAVSNAHELFAELSDPKIREWLASLDYSKNIRKVGIGSEKVPAIAPRSIRNSALGRAYGIMKEMLKLPDFITDAFGNKVDSITALDQMVSLSSRLEKVQRGGGDTQIFTERLNKAEGPKDIQDAIKETESMSNEELVKHAGSATQFMWKLGGKAKTPEDVAALKKMAEESDAKVSALAKEGKIEEAMMIAGRQPAEAYEYATGVKINGESKWPGIEGRQPGYVPPVPDAKYLAAKGEAAKVEPVAASGSSPGLGAGAATTPSSASEPLKVTAPQQPPSPSGAPVEPQVGQNPIAEGAKSQNWTSATEEAPTKPGETLGGQTYAGIPNPAAVYRGIKQAVKDFGPGVKAAGKVVSDAVRDIYKENLNIRKMGDTDRAVLNWSARWQHSFDEASKAQKDVESVVTDAVDKSKHGTAFTQLAEDLATGQKGNRKREIMIQDDALSNWREAGGGRASDNDVQNALVFRRNAATDPLLKAGYEAALHLTPKETNIARDAGNAWDQLWKRAERWGIVDKDPNKPSAFRDDYVTHIWNLGKGAFAGGARTLKDNFRFAKARTFDTFFDGEQAGFVPKTKRLSQLLPIYLHELNSVIAAKQLIKEMGNGKAKDGRPLLAVQGEAKAVDGSKGEATLVKPETPHGDTSDYETIPNQPALHDWTWIGKDTAGNPVFEKSDIALHPEAYKKLKAMLGKSKIKEWYDKPGTGPMGKTMAIPKAFVKGLDIAQSETKRTMLGLISPFHQVQEGTHALGHWVNPFWNVPKPNLDNPAHLDMARHGLMILPDRASEAQFMEGLRPSGLVSKIPGIGPLADFYSNYLFHEYIPGLKIKTYERLQSQNMKTYAKQLASGEVKAEDVKLLTATQVNAAYGHQNYADMSRDPTIQHILQLGLLAPDFLEARTRFTLQAIKGLVPEAGPKGERLTGARGNKVGREQILALATLALGQAALAYTMSKITDGEWDGKHPFEFRKNNRRYTMRSVPEDLMRLFTDSRAFIGNRLNPLITKLPYELYSKQDQYGRRITTGEALKRGGTAFVPLTARGFMGIDKSPLEDWEQLAGAAGIKIMNYSPQNETLKLFQDWKKKSDNPRLREQAEVAEKSMFPTSEYSDLRQAMEKNNFQLGAKAYEKLLETHPAKEIKRAMNPVSIDPSTGTVRDRMLPKALEKQFLGSLSDKDREVYEEAKRQRRVLYQRFQKMLAE